MGQENEAKQLYTKHQAFEEAYKVIEQGAKLDIGFMKRAEQYHHAPDRARSLFNHYDKFFTWHISLHNSGLALVKELSSIALFVEHESKPKQLKNALNLLIKYRPQIEAYRADVWELQLSLLDTSIAERHTYISAVSDVLRNIDNLQTQITHITNRKINEASNNRITRLVMVMTVIGTIGTIFSAYVAWIALNK